ncbi:dihydroneopterin aldolase [Patulibacter minatonensis]|uniref:dihydroneopterin aldolase n=1 Tax=Patulibacter minatonensis TaxID=298163 RepID=UPI0009FF0558|nr:dihydroneopterin aldolase [Patulibacter minatonensis]
MDDERDERPSDDGEDTGAPRDPDARCGRRSDPRDGDADVPDLDADADEDDDDDDLDELDGEERDEVTVEIRGLSLYTHHGVSAAEREIGQRLLVDLRMAVVDCDAVVTDRVADTIDYGEVCQLVALVAQQRSYKTLERLCAAIADRVVADYGAEEVWVKCTKPEPPIPLAVEEVSVELWRAGDGG